MPPAPPSSPPDASYQRWLFFFLAVAGFFEGYDLFALGQILPALRVEMHLSRGDAGLLVGFINIGSILAYFLARSADRWGRRRVLAVTVLGYTVCTVLTGFAPNVALFGLAQLAARIFLGAEWAVATIYAAEEFPAGRRGTVIGVIHGLNGLGAVVAAGVAPLLIGSRFGWRGVYFVGVLPLLLLAVARRSLRETRRFREQVNVAPPSRFTRILTSPWRGRLLVLALIWALTYACTACGVFFWKDFAMTERGLSEVDVSAIISIAALAAMPLTFGVGKLIDRAGRRRGAVAIYALTILGTLGCYNMAARGAIVASLIAAIIGVTGVGVVLAAYNAELFPTELRGDAFGWSNQLLGRCAPLLSPPLVGVIAQKSGWGLAVSLTTLGPALGLILILVLLPETRGRELEETSLPGP
jgi:putative MFS transporter